VDLDLGQVRAFVAAAEHGHFGRAAGALFITQQALSKRVARLEATLGRLFERGPGGVSLTERGERFLPTARELLDRADVALATARLGSGSPLRVDVWGHLHPPLALVRAFAREHREAVLEIGMRRNLPQAVGALERGELDVAFGNAANLGRPLPRHLRTMLVAWSALGALIHEGSELAAAEFVGPVELRRHGLWWPVQTSSPELGGFAVEYAASIGAPLATDGSNVGLEALVERVRTEPSTITVAGLDWPLPTGAGVRVVPIHPVPLYPWYAVWREPATHPLVPGFVAAVGTPPEIAADAWVPAAAREATTLPA
jgi:DNA-binding transcriptional LysR family regulator